MLSAGPAPFRSMDPAGETMRSFGRRAPAGEPPPASAAADDPRLLALAAEARRLSGERGSPELRAYKTERDRFFAAYRVPALLLMLLAPAVVYAFHLSGWWALAAESASLAAMAVRRRGRRVWLAKVNARVSAGTA